jgi:hypothetical protein
MCYKDNFYKWLQCGITSKYPIKNYSYCLSSCSTKFALTHCPNSVIPILHINPTKLQCKMPHTVLFTITFILSSVFRSGPYYVRQANTSILLNMGETFLMIINFALLFGIYIFHWTCSNVNSSSDTQVCN